MTCESWSPANRGLCQQVPYAARDGLVLRRHSGMFQSLGALISRLISMYSVPSGNSQFFMQSIEYKHQIY